MDLTTLLQTPFDQRDESWEDRFFQALTSSSIAFVSPDPHQGPDGWPYMMLTTEGEATEPFQKVLAWSATRGIGLVVNPQKEYPDYVFSYGMIWNFRETGLFFERKAVAAGSIELEPGSSLHAGPPTETYLPLYVRNIIKEFFRDQGILMPKVLVMSTDRIQYDLVFSLDALGNPPTHEHEGIAEAISWFLPPHYSIALLPEDGLPPFLPL